MAYRGVDACERASFPPATDLSKWTLRVSNGRQVWVYGDDDVSASEKLASEYHTGQRDVAGTRSSSSPISIEQACRDGLSFFASV